MTQKPHITEVTRIAKSRIFQIEQVQLQFSNGEQRCYERLQTGNRGAVLIIPMLDAETVILIREYAVGVEDYRLGFPKGAVDAGETALEAAAREIREEIGYGCQQLQQLATLNISPGYIKNETYIMLAQDLYPEKLAGDEPEPLEIIPWSINNLSGLLQHAEFTEARSMAALVWLQDHLHRLDANT